MTPDEFTDHAAYLAYIDACIDSMTYHLTGDYWYWTEPLYTTANGLDHVFARGHIRHGHGAPMFTLKQDMAYQDDDARHKRHCDVCLRLSVDERIQEERYRESERRLKMQEYEAEFDPALAVKAHP